MLTLPPMSRPTLSDEEIAKQGRDRLNLIDSRESNYRIRARDEWHFSHGRQWAENVRIAREEPRIGAPQPCLVVNIIEGMITKLLNEFRQNRPAPNVLPVDSMADIETAEIIQGMVRDIERQCHADMVIDTMVDHQHRLGRGYLRICVEHDNPGSFDLVPRLKPIMHWESVFLDPFHQLGDGSDAQYGLITIDMPKEEFQRAYPKARPVNFEALVRMDSYRLWFRDNAVRIAEYFYVEYQNVPIVQLKDGSVRKSADVENRSLVVNERETEMPQIWQIKMNGQEVLEKYAWPGQYIPIVECVGVEDEVNGQRAYKGLTHNAIGPQQAYNYFASASAEVSGNMPRAPWIAPRGSFTGLERQWREANLRNLPYLEYEPVLGPNGQIAPPPQRQTFDAPIDKLMQLRFFALEDLRLVTGQEPLNANNRRLFGQSADAQDQQQEQADMVNYHLMSNATRSVRRTTEILVDLIVRLYTRQQVVRILGIDGEAELVMINGKTERNGKEKFFSLQNGRYDVAMDPGPSFATRRQHAARGMERLMQAHPPFAPVIGDIFVEQLDVPRAQEAAARLKRTVPPEVLGEDEQTPEQLQAQLAQSQSDFQKLEAYAIERERDIRRLQQELEVARLRVEDKTQDHAVDMAKVELEREKLRHQIELDNQKLALDEETKTRKLDLEEEEMLLDAASGG